MKMTNTLRIMISIMINKTQVITTKIKGKNEMKSERLFYLFTVFGEGLSSVFNFYFSLLDKK